MLITREKYEKREEACLAGYAMCAGRSKGRTHKEERCHLRTDFQRDRDRVVHSEAFRRLEYKTQVFVNHEGDYYRTRLTHTLEVAQVTRGIARSLCLNEDLAEAIALSHDLGHTPFGHSGEAALNEMMKDFGGFEHNHQSYRVVTVIEHRYPKFRGLNLTFELLEGIAKHSSEYDSPNIEDIIDVGYPTLESQVVNVADEIAYINHDVDDGLESGLITLKQLDDISLWNRVHAKAIRGLSKETPKVRKKETIRALIGLFVRDVIDEAELQIAKNKLVTIEDVRERGSKIMRFSPTLTKEAKELKSFLFQNLYRHQRVAGMSATSKRVVKELFEAYSSKPTLMPLSFQEKIPEYSKERIICDYIAGMTDRFALEEHRKLFGSEK